MQQRCYIQECAGVVDRECAACGTPSCPAHIYTTPLQDEQGTIDMTADLCEACAARAYDDPQGVADMLELPF